MDLYFLFAVALMGAAVLCMVWGCDHLGARK